MTIDRTRYEPLGYDSSAERSFFKLGLPAAILWSFLYLLRYASAHQALYYMNEAGDQVLRPDAVMPDFYLLVEHAFLGFPLLAVGILAFTVARYRYHWRGSKPIYLMRRLPDSRELHRRCLTLPLLGLAVVLLTALLLFILYYNSYMRTTPPAALQAKQWQKLWGIAR